MTKDERVAALTEAAATHAVERHDPHAARRRRAALAAAVFLAASLLGGGTWVALRLAELQGQADSNAVIAQRLANQVEQLGADPVVAPPAAGAQGADGRDGVDGVDGKDGRDGRDGKDGVDGTTPPCMTQPAQCRGADGHDGTDGAPGKDGADGQDGKDGVDGKDGAPPAGWTWVDGDGQPQSCTRDGGTDTAPHYACTTEPPPETVPGSPLRIGE